MAGRREAEFVTGEGVLVKASNRLKKATLLGLAFDAEDGHTRLTRGDNYVLQGGSQETHAMLQETAVKINEQLKREGSRLEDVSIRKLHDICREIWK